MAIKHLAQPYLVYIPWNEEDESELGMWLEENIVNYFVVFFVGSGAWIIPSRTDRKAETQKLTTKLMQFQFECPRDALLFKLTWGGK